MVERFAFASSTDDDAETIAARRNICLSPKTYATSPEKTLPRRKPALTAERKRLKALRRPAPSKEYETMDSPHGKKQNIDTPITSWAAKTIDKSPAKYINIETKVINSPETGRGIFHLTWPRNTAVNGESKTYRKFLTNPIKNPTSVKDASSRTAWMGAFCIIVIREKPINREPAQSM